MNFLDCHIQPTLPAERLLQTVPLPGGVLQVGHCMDQDAFQNPKQLWFVFLQVIPQRAEPLLADKQQQGNTTVGEWRDLMKK